MEKYDVISVVGEGSYGLVLRCRHRDSGQYVAIKKFLETEDDPTVRKMAIREIRMLKKLRHENLVNMIEVFRRKKRFFLVFEYLEHTILEELEARSGGLGFATSRKYIYQVLRALDFIHSNNVIHRDIKPENVLVSRLGVIKLCDFGFARPFQENETFTDYVATRWYRSPELLVGDPRYGKEVDIWATGCLYAEMMTGEPLFPGESDVDQLFQIVRVLGKVNARHQLLITRNTMFKGMKQEQNSSLSQLFPDWNRDSLTFLNQCLRMDGAVRPDTGKLLKYDLFTRDDFVETFLPELRSKLNQELQGNPLLKRLHGLSHPLRKPEERKSSNGNISTTEKSSTKEHNLKQTKGQIGLSLNQILNQQNPHLPDKTSMTKFPEPSSIRSSQGSDELNFNLAHYKHYLTNQHNKSLLSHSNNSKPLHINNLTLSKDTPMANFKYGARILSAKHHKLMVGEKAGLSSIAAAENVPIQPPSPSPVQFQSLQHESIANPQFANLMDKHLSQNSPLTINNLTLNGTNIPSYFANKRSTNLLNNNLHRPPIGQVPLVAATKYSPLPLGAARTNLAKRERGMLLEVGQHAGANQQDNNRADPSPRVLPTPAWLMGNLKITSHGKTTQIGKKGVTDWKSVVGSQNTTNPIGNTENGHLPEISLPSCPGALSPAKNLKAKRLVPMTNLTASMHPPQNYANNLDGNYFATPRHFSASSQKEGET